MDNENKDIEQHLSELLSSDERGRGKADEEALQKLAPKYEIRIQVEHDPIAEETKQYRSMAEEVDDRYDRYVPRSNENNIEEKDD